MLLARAAGRMVSMLSATSGGQLHGFRLQAKRATDDLRAVQQIQNEPVLHLGIPFDDLERPVDTRGLNRSLPQHRGCSPESH